MGSEFFWFYDVLLVAIVIAMIFKGSKKGAVAVLISAVSAIISFLLARSTQSTATARKNKILNRFSSLISSFNYQMQFHFCSFII